MVSETVRAFPLNLRTLSLILVVFGILVSGYLSYTKATDTTLVCEEGGGFDCGIVQNSRYAEVAGVAIAYLGLLAYVTMGMLLVLENRSAFLQEYGLMILFVLTLAAFLYSMYLVYLQGVVLGAWCQWCLAHETIMTGLFAVTAWRMWQRMVATQEG